MDDHGDHDRMAPLTKDKHDATVPYRLLSTLLQI